MLKEDSVELELSLMHLRQIVTTLTKVQEIVFTLIASRASVTKQLPVQILRQAGEIWVEGMND